MKRLEKGVSIYAAPSLAEAEEYGKFVFSGSAPGGWGPTMVNRPVGFAVKRVERGNGFAYYDCHTLVERDAP